MFTIQFSPSGREKDYAAVGMPHETIPDGLFWLFTGTKTLKRGIARLVDADGKWLVKVYGQDTED
jgi:hypothetical protein